jgi:hypothetical protein
MHIVTEINFIILNLEQNYMGVLRLKLPTDPRWVNIEE